MENNSLSSSDFIINDINVQHPEQRFANVQEIYSSSSGYNRIFLGERYGKIHALKTLQDSYNLQPFYLQALRKEFNIGYQLDHPHICHTLGWEEVEGIGQCIILEYIDAITLQDMLEQQTFNQELANKIIVELCEALGYLHKKQIVHRDLKPSNILITHNGNNVKLIDFGLSDCDDYDILKLPAGTRYYVAPEILNSTGPLDSRSDIYSLGIIIGEIAMTLNDKKLAAISRKCTQRSPQKRYASTTEIIDQINCPEKSIWTAQKLIPTLCILVALGAFSLFLTNNQTHHFHYPVFGNTSILNKNCRKILLQERKKIKEIDSLSIVKQLKETLDNAYPLPQQKASLTYRQQWEAIQEEISRIIHER